DLCGIAHHFDEVLAFDANGGDVSLNVRWRKNQAEVHDHIVAIGGDSRHLAGFDQSGQVDSESVHQPFHWKVQSLDFLCMQADFSVRSGTQSSRRLEGNISFIVELAVNFEAAFVDRHGNIFQR